MYAWKDVPMTSPDKPYACDGQNSAHIFPCIYLGWFVGEFKQPATEPYKFAYTRTGCPKKNYFDR